MKTIIDSLEISDSWISFSVPLGYSDTLTGTNGYSNHPIEVALGGYHDVHFHLGRISKTCWRLRICRSMIAGQTVEEFEGMNGDRFLRKNPEDWPVEFLEVGDTGLIVVFKKPE